MLRRDNDEGATYRQSAGLRRRPPDPTTKSRVALGGTPNKATDDETASQTRPDTSFAVATDHLRPSVRVVPLPKDEVRRRQQELARILLEMEEADQLGKARRHDSAA